MSHSLFCSLKNQERKSWIKLQNQKEDSRSQLNKDKKNRNIPKG
jgi:hypothetical protein